MKRNRLQQLGLVLNGAVAGILISLNFSAVANRDAMPLPIDELRAFTEVYGRIKSDYVEPVSDEKLIKEAINGMVHGHDPHSDFLDAEAFKDLQITPCASRDRLARDDGASPSLLPSHSRPLPSRSQSAARPGGTLILGTDWPQDEEPQLDDCDPDDRRLYFSLIGGEGILTCVRCGHEAEVIGFLHGFGNGWSQTGLQCQTCGRFGSLERLDDGSLVRHLCDCPGEPTRDDPLLCPACRSSSLDYSMTGIS